MIITVTATGCSGSRQTDVLLRQAGDSVMTNPGYSALILDSMRAGDLGSDSRRALHALLSTQAHTRLRDSIPSDSIIRFAADYYDAHPSDNRRLMLALYYLGQTRLDRGESTRAFVPLLRSYELASRMSDNHWIGMTARALSDLYGTTFSRKEELEMAVREEEAFRLEGDSVFIAYAGLDRSRALANNFMFNQAIALTDTVIDNAATLADPYLYSEALRVRATALMGLDRWEEAATFDAFAGTEYMTSLDSVNMAEAVLCSGDISRGRSLFWAISVPDNIHGWQLRYEFFRQLGMTAHALHALEQVDSLTNEILAAQITHDISGELQRYQEQSSRQLATELSYNRRMSAAAIVIALLVIVTLVAMILYRRQLHRSELDKALALIDELKSTEKNLPEPTAGDDAYSLLRLNYSFFDRLLTAADSRDRVSEKTLLNEINRSLDELVSSDGRLGELAAEIDRYTGSAISRFYEALPALPAKDYRLFIFAVLGFSNNALVPLLKAPSIQAVYDRKRCLRIKINTISDPTMRREFLGYL